jgi:CHAD domain-containing protein
MSRGPSLATAGARAGAFLVERLRTLDARLDAVVPRVLASDTDEDAVHDLRVTLRRLRTVLELGRSVLGRFRSDEVRRALRDVQRATGSLRDEEVLRALVGSLGVGHPDVERWLGARRARERRLRGAFARSIRAGSVDRGRALLHALVAFRVKPSHDKRLTRLARRAVDRARRDVERRRGADIEDPEALHGLRIAYKRLRYAIESFSEALPTHTVDQAQHAARMQNRLGGLHDVDVAIDRARRARALGPEARAELLVALERERASRAAACAREAGAPATAARPQADGVVALRKISTR